MNKFKDHFSEKTLNYARYRPDYPDALFGFLAGQCSDHQIAWDCATGNGQSAIKLAGYFDKVIATDASEKQIKQARALKAVEFSLATAEQSGLKDSSVDLVTVAQALHWFDIDAFSLELQRVVKPGGLFAAWTYNLLRISTAIDEIIDHLYSNVLAGYWPQERQMVENAYADIAFPWDEIATPIFSMQQQWDLNELMGYLSTWSAVKQYMQKNADNPLEKISSLLKTQWSDDKVVKTVEWPLTIRLWRK